MCDRPWETMTDADFEAMLARSVPDTPPEEIVADVTPWRRAMNRILFGMALCAITLNFWCLNYILPAIGTVLLLLGFRALRRENRWLGGCFAVTVIRAACFFRHADPEYDDFAKCRVHARRHDHAHRHKRSAAPRPVLLLLARAAGGAEKRRACPRRPAARSR